MAKKTLTTTEQNLAQVRLFKKLDKRQIKELARVADVISVPEGKTLITEGTVGRELIVIVDGAAEVRRGEKTIATLGAGDTVGEMSLLDHQATSATVVATAPCELCVIEGRRFGPLLEEMPGLAAGLLAEVCSRLRAADQAFDV